MIVSEYKISKNRDGSNWGNFCYMWSTLDVYRNGYSKVMHHARHGEL